MKKHDQKRALATLLVVSLLFSLGVTRVFGDEGSAVTENPETTQEQANLPETPLPETHEEQGNEAVTPGTEAPAVDPSTETGAPDDQTTGVTPENPGSEEEATETEPTTIEEPEAATAAETEEQAIQAEPDPKTVCVCLEERLCVHNVYECCNVCPDCLSAAAEAATIEPLEETTDRQAATFSDLSNAITAAPAGASYVIEITADFDFTDVITIPVGKKIVLMSNGNFTLTTQGAYRHFLASGELTLMPGVTLTNRNTTDNGGGVQVGSAGVLNIRGGSINGNVNNMYGGGVYCGGTVNLYSGTIDRNRSQDTGGGGVFVYSGTFHMYGGSVSNNHAANSGGSGGGVFVNKLGSFILYDGIINGNISDHTAQGGGGVYILGDGRFEMRGGTISNNIATAAMGGGVSIATSNFTITGGLITGNTATKGGGVFYSSSAANISNTTISNNTASVAGGGVYANAAALNMTNVTVTGNSAAIDGGGIYYKASVADGFLAFDMTGGLIANNVADDGGGVFLGSSSIFNLNGVTISNNRALGEYGAGGIYAAGTLNLTDSKIIGNTAVTSVGGGLRVTSAGRLNMISGEITDNVSATNGGGIYTYDYTHLTISNTAVFNRNVAGAAYDYGIANRGAGGAVPDINWAGDNSIPGTHLLNNYDVNYTGGSPLSILTVTFDENHALGNTVQRTVLSSVGIIGAASMPANPVRDGYDFIEWNTAADGSGSAFTASTPVTADITVYAIWLAKPVPLVYFTVTFLDWDGTLIKTEQVLRGNAATAPADPERTGYVFVGWDDVFTNITEDKTINALYQFIVVEVVTPDPDPETPVPPVVVIAPKTPIGKGTPPATVLPKTGDYGIFDVFLVFAGVVLMAVGMLPDPHKRVKHYTN
jgi:uncharacterized repeat protein (TIGR02543 family)